MRLADVSIRRPVFAVMLVGALIALGWISLGRLGVDLFPKVEFPNITVSTVLEGATPQTIESEITDPIEEAVNTISGIKLLRSASSEGLSQVFIEFELEEDVDAKAQDVRDKVSVVVGDLPVDIEPPVVEKMDPDSAPIMSIMLSGDLSIRELSDFADDVLKEQIQRIPGVGSVTLVGDRERQVRVWLDADRLRSYALTADDVLRALAAEHAEVPGGRMESDGKRSEFSVKTKGEVKTVREFENIVVAFRDGAPTYIRDLARVEDGAEDERTYAELNGRRGISLEIRRQSGRNTVAVARAVKEMVSNISNLPPGTRIVVARDISRFIESSVHDVARDMEFGVFLVVVVILGFLLSLRATVIVAVAIPAAIVSTFFAFYVAGFTINLLTLMALSVSIGLLVDDAIVVLESIHRHIQDGYPPFEAARLGVSKVGGAVLAGTASVMAVFVPIAFMSGVVGRFFFQYGLAIVFAVGVSLLVSLTLTPTMCARLLRKNLARTRLSAAAERAYEKLERGYARLLDGALRLRFLVIVLAALSVVVGVVFAKTIPFAFTSKADRSEFLATVELELGSGIEQAKTVGSRVARSLRGMEDVKSVFFTVGAGSRGRVNEIAYYVELTPKRDRARGEVAVMDLARRRMHLAAPEAKNIAVTEVPWVSGGGNSNFDMEYSLRGPDLQVLDSLTNRIMAAMRDSGVMVDVQSSYDTGKPELQVHVDRARAADLGVSVRTLADTVRSLIGGIKATTFEDDGERYDVRVRLEEGQQNDLGRLGSVQLRAADGRLVDLANVAEFRLAAGPAQIDREDRSRKIGIFASVAPGYALGTATDTLDRILAGIDMPQGYSGAHQGHSKRMKDSIAAIRFAFAMALVALYMILASQFNSFVQPGVIMLTAPLSFSGAFIALSLSGQSLSLFAQIGLVALMGLVMKNGILLVDYANQMAADGGSARDAMRKAAPVRLRPVLMTALSTIFGMIPVAMSTSDGAEFRTALGILVIGGLSTSTLLTLVVIPVAYTLMEDARVLTRRALAWALGLFGPSGHGQAGGHGQPGE